MSRCSCLDCSVSVCLSAGNFTRKSEWRLLLRRFRVTQAGDGSVGGLLRSAELPGCFRSSAGEGTALLAWLVALALAFSLSLQCFCVMTV